MINIEKKYNYLKKYIEIISLNDEEFIYFLYNYYDAIIFNDYLSDDDRYLNLEFNIEDKLLKLVDFFESNDIDKKVAKEILISMPMILYCDDLENDLHLIYKGDNLEGVLIYDEKGNCYPYRKTNHLRSIMQNHSFLEDLKMNDVANNNYCQKTFYTKNNYRKRRKR